MGDTINDLKRDFMNQQLGSVGKSLPDVERAYYKAGLDGSLPPPSLPTLESDVNTVYQQANPSLGVEIDTGYNPSALSSVASLTFSLTIEITGSGNQYALFQQISPAMILNLQPDLRISRSSEFEGVSGDASFAFWLDSVTDTIHFECGLDGGGKTVELASILTCDLVLS